MSKNPILAKIAKARATRGGNYIKDGKYLFTVRKILIEQKEGGNCFIVELLVDESADQPGNFEKNGRAVWAGVEGAIEVKACPVGSSPSLVLNLDTNKSAPANAKAFVCALLGVEEDQVSDDDFIETLGELVAKEQPGRGMQIADETFRKKIKGGDNAGAPFVGHNWENVKQTADEIKARRAKLDKADADAAKAA